MAAKNIWFGQLTFPKASLHKMFHEECVLESSGLEMREHGSQSTVLHSTAKKVRAWIQDLVDTACGMHRGTLVSGPGNPASQCGSSVVNPTRAMVGVCLCPSATNTLSYETGPDTAPTLGAGTHVLVARFPADYLSCIMKCEFYSFMTIF